MRTCRRTRNALLTLGALSAFALILAASTPTPTAAQASKREPLTIEGFQAGLTDEPLANVRFERFDCGADLMDNALVSCSGNARRYGAGAVVAFKGKATTRELTFAAITIANPAAFAGRDREDLASLYLLLMARTIRIISSNASPKAKGDMIERLAQNMDREVNEVRLGSWIYSAGGGIMLAFAVERAK